MKLNPLDASCIDTCLVGQALDGMCVGLVLVSPAGKVAWMNRVAQRTLGAKGNDAIGQPVSQVLKDPQLAEFWHECQACNDTCLGDVSVHWPRPAELKINTTPCVDYSGQQIGRAIIFCDVTAERTVQVKLSQEATERLLAVAGSWEPDAEPHAGLTPQEVRVLRQVGSGQSNQQIAEEMHVAPSTVRSHLKHIYSKLGLSSRSEAIRYAIKNGLT